MQSRVLPLAEWWRLADTELGPALPYLPPDSEVIVLEDGEQIVACWAAMRYVHLEGLWIHPNYRGHGLLRQLIALMRQVIRQVFDVKVVLTAALTEEVALLIEQHGGRRLPGEHYAIPLKEN